MFGLNQYDLQLWQALCACLFGMTAVITPAVFFHFRREQTMEWDHRRRTQDLKFQTEMLQQPTAHLKFEDNDADTPSRSTEGRQDLPEVDGETA